MRKEGQPKDSGEFERMSEHDKNRLGLVHYAGSSVAHARVVLDEHEAGPVVVHYQGMRGVVTSFATEYNGFWSHPVTPDSDYTFCARWENSVEECPSRVIFTKEDIQRMTPQEIFRDPSEYQD